MTPPRAFVEGSLWGLLIGVLSLALVVSLGWWP